VPKYSSLHTDNIKDFVLHIQKLYPLFTLSSREFSKMTNSNYPKVVENPCQFFWLIIKLVNQPHSVTYSYKTRKKVLRIFLERFSNMNFIKTNYE
jgi:hypothetical protein